MIAIFQMGTDQEVAVRRIQNGRSHAVWTSARSLQIGEHIGIAHGTDGRPLWAAVASIRPASNPMLLEVELVFGTGEEVNFAVREPLKAIIKGLNDAPCEIRRRSLWERLDED